MACRYLDDLDCTFTVHLTGAGTGASIGTAGGAPGNALMESQTGMYKTEPIKPRGPWRSLTDAGLATAGYADWCNIRWLHSHRACPACPARCPYYAQTQPQPVAEPNN